MLVMLDLELWLLWAIESGTEEAGFPFQALGLKGIMSFHISIWELPAYAMMGTCSGSSGSSFLNSSIHSLATGLICFFRLRNNVAKIFPTKQTV